MKDYISPIPQDRSEVNTYQLNTEQSQDTLLKEYIMKRLDTISLSGLHLVYQYVKYLQ